MKAQPIRTRFVAVLACVSLTGAFAATTYTLTDLGPGGANDINTSGKVVGGGPAGPWVYDGTTRTNLQFQQDFINAPPGSRPSPSGGIVSAVAISDSGRIIGESFGGGPLDPLFNLFGYYYDGGGVATLLGLTSSGDPHGVSPGGEVVGYPFYFDGNTSLVGLPGFASDGRAINAAGLIVGNLRPGDSATTMAATFTTNTYSLLDLSPLAGLINSPLDSSVLSVNATGQMVGYVRYGGSAPIPSYQVSVAFLYTNGLAISLGGLGGIQSVAQDINGAGLIVGRSMLADQSFHAFVYANDTMADLNPLISVGGAGWVLTSANAVNDSGVIVGEGTKDGVAHAFLLTPVAGNLPPAVNAQPVGTNLFAGEAFTLAVTAAGSGPLTYQWQHAGTNVPAATNVTYTVAHATPDDGGVYQVLVTNAFGTTPSDSVTVQVKVLAGLQVGVYAGIRVTGPVGGTFRIEAVDQVGDTNWQALGNVTLSSSTFLWVDSDTLHPGRFYRAVPLP